MYKLAYNIINLDLTGQSLVGFGVVGTAPDQFRGGHAGSGKMELVLNDAEKLGGLRPGRIVITRHGEDLFNPQVHPSFAGADIADAFEQFVEVVRNGRTGHGRILQPLVVHGETLDDILLQALRRPDAETGGNQAFYAVADGNDHVQIVVIKLALDIATALFAN
jgi:hypothetical protein